MSLAFIVIAKSILTMTEKRFKRVLTHCMLLLTVVMLGSCTSDKFEAKIALKGLGNQNVHVVYCGADGGVVDTWMMAQSDRLEIAGSCASPSLLVLYNGMNVPIMRLVVSGGGKGKGFAQIKDMPDSYVVNDGVEVGIGNKIPLWLFGFMY